TFSQTNGIPGTTRFIADTRIWFDDGMSQSVTGGGAVLIQGPFIRTGANGPGVQSAALLASGPITVQANGAQTGTLTFEKFAPAVSATLNLNGAPATTVSDSFVINPGTSLVSDNVVTINSNGAATATINGTVQSTQAGSGNKVIIQSSFILGVAGTGSVVTPVAGSIFFNA